MPHCKCKDKKPSTRMIVEDAIAAAKKRKFLSDEKNRKGRKCTKS